jgi:ABC-type branched-subunit amino acid transport system permease subunit
VLVSARAGFIAVGAYAAALAVAKLDDPAAQHDAYRRERAWQSDWIARAVIGARADG